MPVDTVLTASAVRLRGLDVVIDLRVDGAELALRRVHALGLCLTDVAALGALLQIPTLSSTPLVALPAAARHVARRWPRVIEQVGGDRVRRRVSPIAYVEMVTLVTSHWRKGMREIGRFAPYSARLLQLPAEPSDLDLLCMEATYWGVGVRIESSGAWHDVVHPAPFTPARYTGASWAFAEQAMAAAQAVGLSPWLPASA